MKNTSNWKIWLNAVCALLWLFLASEARAATITVTSAADSGPGSLRDALSDANPGDTVNFANTLAGQTIYLTSGELLISVGLTIDASALPGGAFIDAGSNSRVLEIDFESVVNLNSLTLTNGLASGNGGGILLDPYATLTASNCVISGNSIPDFSYGGGIYAGYGSRLTLNYCTLSDNSAPVSTGGGIENGGVSTTLNNCTLCGNSAGDGGGIDNPSILTLNNCTIFGNSAEDGWGGGIYNSDVLTINNCTVCGNSAFEGGGILLTSGTDTPFLTNSIVAENTATYDPDISGMFAGADNFTNGNPQLCPLGNYGGPTQSMPPLPGSPAIDAGDDDVTNFFTVDERGYLRLSGAHVDMGAVEAQYAPSNNPPLLNASRHNTSGPGSFQFSFTNAADADFTVLASTNLALPLTNWTILGNIPEITPGQYQFGDTGMTNWSQRFYRVVSP